MPHKLTPFDAADHITTDERARAYFEACADEDPGDGSVIRAAIGTIVRARAKSRLILEVGVEQSILDEELSENGDLSLTTVLKIAKALGLRIRFEAIEKPQD